MYEQLKRLITLEQPVQLTRITVRSMMSDDSANAQCRVVLQTMYNSMIQRMQVSNQAPAHIHGDIDLFCDWAINCWEKFVKAYAQLVKISVMYETSLSVFTDMFFGALFTTLTLPSRTTTSYVGTLMSELGELYGLAQVQDVTITRIALQ
jgi:hypothetical protein